MYNIIGRYIKSRQQQNRPPNITDVSRENPSRKRISLQNVIVLFDLKNKIHPPALPACHGRTELQAQCASKRDTE